MEETHVRKERLMLARPIKQLSLPSELERKRLTDRCVSKNLVKGVQALTVDLAEDYF
jgi:hypothetical protein